MAKENIYLEVRKNAAKYNQDFAKRRTAVEHLPGVSEDSLKKYELGINRVPEQVVGIMAAAYGCPELKYWYCKNECPLGGDICPAVGTLPERSIIRIQSHVGILQENISKLAEIFEDGIVDETELSVLQNVVLGDLIESKKRLSELVLMVEKTIARKAYPDMYIFPLHMEKGHERVTSSAQAHR